MTKSNPSPEEGMNNFQIAEQQRSIDAAQTLSPLAIEHATEIVPALDSDQALKVSLEFAMGRTDDRILFSRDHFWGHMEDRGIDVAEASLTDFRNVIRLVENEAALSENKPIHLIRLKHQDDTLFGFEAGLTPVIARRVREIQRAVAATSINSQATVYEAKAAKISLADEIAAFDPDGMISDLAREFIGEVAPGISDVQLHSEFSKFAGITLRDTRKIYDNLVATGQITKAEGGNNQYAYSYSQSDVESAVPDEERRRREPLSSEDIKVVWAMISFMAKQGNSYVKPRVIAALIQESKLLNDGIAVDAKYVKQLANRLKNEKIIESGNYDTRSGNEFKIRLNHKYNAHLAVRDEDFMDRLVKALSIGEPFNWL